MNNLPWFKFNPDEWQFGSITSQDMCIQGLFINICGYYWKKQGIVSIEEIEKKYGRFDGLNLLFGSCLYKNDNMLVIKFLDEQLNDNGIRSQINSINGKKGAEEKLKNRLAATSKRPPSDRQATAKQTPSEVLANIKQTPSEPLADRDIELDLEEENKKNISFLAGKKIKPDIRITKELKRLDKLGKISLAEIENIFFLGQGTEAVISAFQTDFFEQDKKYFPGTAVETSYNGWINRLKIKKLSKNLDEQLPPTPPKLTPALESEMAEFRILEGVHEFLRGFVMQSKAKDRKALITLLINEFGLEKAVRRMFVFNMRHNRQAEYFNTVEQYEEIQDKLNIPDDQWEEIKKGREIVFSK
jgi:hypothetical protein